jgi:N-acetylneuraminic acid mutarotase
MPRARDHFGAATAADGLLYAVGVAGNVSQLVDVYTPSTRMWAAAPSLIIGRDAAAVVVGADGAIYAVAGRNPGGYVTDTVEKLTGGQWTTLSAHLLTARQEHAAVALGDGHVYALGGLGGFADPKLDSIESMAANATAFVAGRAMTQARDLLAAATVNGRIYVIGGNAYGYVDGGTSVLGLVEAYDPATRTWTRVASLSTPRFGLAAAVGSDGKIYVVGGNDGNGAVGTLEVLTP